MQPPLEITVRRLTSEDAESFRDIRLAGLASAPEAFGSTHDEEASRTVEAFAARLEQFTLFGAFSEERIIGVAGFMQESAPKVRHKGILWGMFVRPEFSGRGYGRALVQAVIDHAMAKVEQVTLSVIATNIRAIALYESMGFQRYGVEPRALKSHAAYSDEALMVRFCRPGPRE